MASGEVQAAARAPDGVGAATRRVEPSISIQIEGGVGDGEHGAWHRGGDGVRRRRPRGSGGGYVGRGSGVGRVGRPGRPAEWPAGPRGLRGQGVSPLFIFILFQFLLFIFLFCFILLLVDFSFIKI